ncbi:MAG TPA: hypothetical protein VFK32_08045, partial [Tepidiformaceae bacterium]|nr:hypothetical protein [Tepidiformaceae bacterium]
ARHGPGEGPFVRIEPGYVNWARKQAEKPVREQRPEYSGPSSSTQLRDLPNDTLAGQSRSAD